MNCIKIYLIFLNLFVKIDLFFNPFHIVKGEMNKSVMFFSLDRLLTKKQMLNTKCQPKCFLVIAIWKEKMTTFPILISVWNNNKDFGWHLVLSIRFLVTGRSTKTETNFVCFFEDERKLKIPFWDLATCIFTTLYHIIIVVVMNTARSKHKTIHTHAQMFSFSF